MMQCFLMRRAASLPAEIDRDRPLSSVGRDAAERCGRGLLNLGVRFDEIAASPQLRSRETAEIVARLAGLPKAAVRVAESLGPVADVETTLELLRELRPAARVLLVGHQPHLGRLAARIIARSERVSIDLDQGGVMRVDVDDLTTGSGSLKWLLRAGQLTVFSGGSD